MENWIAENRKYQPIFFMTNSILDYISKWKSPLHFYENEQKWNCNEKLKTQRRDDEVYLHAVVISMSSSSMAIDVVDSGSWTSSESARSVGRKQRQQHLRQIHRAKRSDKAMQLENRLLDIK